jgi:hypothetical protein
MCGRVGSLIHWFSENWPAGSISTTRCCFLLQLVEQDIQEIGQGAPQRPKYIDHLSSLGDLETPSDYVFNNASPNLSLVVWTVEEKALWFTAGGSWPPDPFLGLVFLRFVRFLVQAWHTCICGSRVFGSCVFLCVCVCAVVILVLFSS